MTTPEDKPTDKQFVKRIFGYTALLFSFGVFIMVFVIGLIGWMTIDEAEKLVNEATDTACTGIKTADSTFQSAGQSVDELADAFRDGGASFVDLAASVRGMANSMDTLNQTASDNMAESADAIEEMGDSIQDQSASFAEMKQDLETLRSSLNSQRDTVCGGEITNMFGTAKILFVVSLLLLVGLLLIIGLNAGRGVV